MRRLRMMSLLSVMVVATSAQAVEVGDFLSIHGFGRWAYGNTVSSPNNYVFASPGGQYDSGQFALMLSGHMGPQAMVAAQVDFDPDAGGLSLDWAFGEYRFNDLLRVHAGKFKHAYGLWGETLKVGTLQPFL